MKEDETRVLIDSIQSLIRATFAVSGDTDVCMDTSLGTFIRDYAVKGIYFTTEKPGKTDKVLTEKLNKALCALLTLGNMYADLRTDVSEYAIECYDNVRNDKELPLLESEKRYITAKIPGTDIRVEYDTLVTEISFIDSRAGSKWEQCVEHEYSDGGIDV